MTHYEILRVPENATPEAIKAAFRARAKQTHSDTKAGSAASAAAFSQVNDAYEVLRDAVRRATYDRELMLERFRAIAAAKPRPVPVPQRGMSAGQILGTIVVSGFVGAVLASAFGGSSSWDATVGRYRGPDGRFTPG
jgi:curved DNA-binding protein CbpA